MNFKNIPNGSYPTMITPFTEQGEIDYETLEQFVEFLIQKGSDGLFSTCQSSCMFFLSEEERCSLTKAVVRFARGRVPVIASGHISDSLDDQIRELNLIAEAGANAVVMITNRPASPTDSDEVWIKNTKVILKEIPENIALGLYECPYPENRLLSDDLLSWAASCGRFHFLKDTCCNPQQITRRAALVKNTPLKLFNAHSGSLLHSLQLGYAGYSGVMGNCQPHLYSALCRKAVSSPEQAALIQDYLSVTSWCERLCYPVNVKYYLQLCGIPFTLKDRRRSADELTPGMRIEMENFLRFSALREEELLPE